MQPCDVFPFIFVHNSQQFVSECWHNKLSFVSSSLLIWFVSIWLPKQGNLESTRRSATMCLAVYRRARSVLTLVYQSKTRAREDSNGKYFWAFCNSITCQKTIIPSLILNRFFLSDFRTLNRNLLSTQIVNCFSSAFFLSRTRLLIDLFLAFRVSSGFRKNIKKP